MAEPRVKYAPTSDGVNIAFADTGGEGVAVVYMRGSPFTHVREEWKQASYSLWFENTFAKRRLITFDCRGCGLSDRDGGELSVEAFGRDIAAVADKLGLESFVLSAAYSDGMAAISCAADHPERVSHLIRWDTFAEGSRFTEIPQTKAFLSMMENDWDLFATTLGHYMNGWDTPAATEYVGFLRDACTQGRSTELLQELRDAGRGHGPTDACHTAHHRVQPQERGDPGLRHGAKPGRAPLQRRTCRAGRHLGPGWRRPNPRGGRARPPHR